MNKEHPGTMPTIRKTLDLLTSQERGQAYLLLVMILVMAFLDMVGVASILPFLAVLGNPEVVKQQLGFIGGRSLERSGFQ